MVSIIDLVNGEKDSLISLAVLFTSTCYHYA
jgi:hypothetical protein